MDETRSRFNAAHLIDLFNIHHYFILGQGCRHCCRSVAIVAVGLVGLWHGVTEREHWMQAVDLLATPGLV